MSLVSQFRSLLSTAVAPLGLDVCLWPGAERASANLLQIGTAPQRTLLYVKGSSNSPGFWGLTKNQINRLSASQNRWFCVFLHKDPAAGYLLSGGQIVSRIGAGDLTLAGDGDYKVNQRSEFVESQRFEGIQALLSRVL